MSDDRTIDASPRRLREARERGQVASSAELTAAVALLAAVAAMGAWGDALIDGLAGLMRAMPRGEGLVVADADAFVVRVRGAFGAVAAPLAGILAAPAVAGLLAHQVQVGGLFLPALVLPDPSRLRPGAAGGTPADRLGRAAGLLARGAVLAALVWWSIRPVLRGIGAATVPVPDPEALLREAGGLLHATAFRLGLALLAMGLVHLAWQSRRLAARLRISPEEQREDLRSQEGDPALRSRRRDAAGRRRAAVANIDRPEAAGPV